LCNTFNALVQKLLHFQHFTYFPSFADRKYVRSRQIANNATLCFRLSDNFVHLCHNYYVRQCAIFSKVNIALNSGIEYGTLYGTGVYARFVSKVWEIRESDIEDHSVPSVDVILFHYRTVSQYHMHKAHSKQNTSTLVSATFVTSPWIDALSTSVLPRHLYSVLCRRHR